MLATFSSEFIALQDSILLKSYHPDVGTICECGTGPALYRCVGQEFCFNGKLYCKACIRKNHAQLPFHCTKMWNGNNFVNCPLDTLDYILYLGHSGQQCPNLSQATCPHPMMIVHTNRFHKLSVHFCCCNNHSSEPLQLCNQQLFPSTMTQPQTAFTFAVLDNCHLHMLSSKKSMYDYHNVLVKMMNPTFPQDIAVCFACPIYQSVANITLESIH